MKQSMVHRGVLLGLASLLPAACLDAQVQHHVDTLLGTSVISGMVRDADGVPQMGALVQALLPDATLAGSAITDARGRYRFYVQPGSYRIRATAALLLAEGAEVLAVDVRPGAPDGCRVLVADVADAAAAETSATSTPTRSTATSTTRKATQRWMRRNSLSPALPSSLRTTRIALACRLPDRRTSPA